MRLVNFCGYAIAVFLIPLMLFTVMQGCIFWDKGYYAKEYLKYEVFSAVKMEEKDLLYVTDEMLSYLKDKRNDLNIETVVDGQKREFFNEREKLHMKDVKALFLKAFFLRKICFIFICLGLFFLYIKKASIKEIVSKAVFKVMVASIIIYAAAGSIIASDFNKYFTLFHELFFNNDLWILDPATDLLINIVPEGFFADMVLKIGGIFVLLTFAAIAVSFFVLKGEKKKQNWRG